LFYNEQRERGERKGGAREVVWGEETTERRMMMRWGEVVPFGGRFVKGGRKLKDEFGWLLRGMGLRVKYSSGGGGEGGDCSGAVMSKVASSM